MIDLKIVRQAAFWAVWAALLGVPSLGCFKATSDEQHPDALPGCSPQTPTGPPMLDAYNVPVDAARSEIWLDCGNGSKPGVTDAEFCSVLSALCPSWGQTTRCLAMYRSSTPGRQACLAYHLCRAGLPALPDQPWDVNRKRCCPTPNMAECLNL